MVEIFSKQDGPRREDVQVKRLIEENRGVITRLADQFSGGRYSESKKPKPVPRAEGLIIHIGDSTKPVREPEPKIRVTTNGRVIVVDDGTGRQLQYFGEIREARGALEAGLALPSPARPHQRPCDIDDVIARSGPVLATTLAV